MSIIIFYYLIQKVSNCILLKLNENILYKSLKQKESLHVFIQFLYFKEVYVNHPSKMKVFLYTCPILFFTANGSLKPINSARTCSDCAMCMTIGSLVGQRFEKIIFIRAWGACRPDCLLQGPTIMLPSAH